MPNLRVLVFVSFLASCATVASSPQKQAPPAPPPPSRPTRPAPAPASGWTPVELGLLSGVQVAGTDKDVYGLRLDLISGDNHAVYGVDLNIGAGEQATGGGGVAAALVQNAYGDDFTGIQLAVGLNRVTDAAPPDAAINGLQIAVIGNAAHEVNGLQAAILNLSDRVRGLQLGVVGSAGHLEGMTVAGVLSVIEDGYGVQIAPVNHCHHTLHGIQIGLFNQTDRGLQLGLLNINSNGFLPVCPIFNF